jgi:hypothetical protein
MMSKDRQERCADVSIVVVADLREGGGGGRREREGERKEGREREREEGAKGRKER